MHTVIRGRLSDSSTAPANGELVVKLIDSGGSVVEQILSGMNSAPVEYYQDHDEWVVLLAGSAELELRGKTLTLTPGDWVLLPRCTPHRLVKTAQGTSWIAVHFSGQPTLPSGV